MQSPPRSASVRLKILLLLGSIVAALGLVELALRIVSPITGFYPQLYLRPNRRTQFIWDPPLPGVSRVSMYTTDRWGVRGDEPPPSKDWPDYDSILVIGGSTAECGVLDDHKTWPYLLQVDLAKSRPKVWVGNAGASGETTFGHLIIVRQVVPRIKPKAMLFLVGLNDMLDSFSGAGKTSALLWNPVGWRNSVIAYSRVLQLLMRAYKTRFGVKIMRQNWAYKERPVENEFRFPDDPTPMLPTLASFRSNVKTMIGLGRAMGVEPIFLTQPMLFDDSARWRKADSDQNLVPGRRVSGAEFWRLLTYFNRELLRLCAEEHVRCFDLASRIPHSSDYFYDTVHFNEAGARRVADETAGFLAATPSIQSGSDQR